MPPKKSDIRGVRQIDIEIGNRIRAYRIERGISQDGLGDKLAVSFQQVQKYEKGVNRLSVGRLIELCKVLQTTPHDILGWDHKASAKLPDVIDIESFKLVREFQNLNDALRGPIRALIMKLIDMDVGG